MCVVMHNLSEVLMYIRISNVGIVSSLIQTVDDKTICHSVNEHVHLVQVRWQ